MQWFRACVMVTNVVRFGPLHHSIKKFLAKSLLAAGAERFLDLHIG